MDSRTLILSLGWTLLVSGNAMLFPDSGYTFAFPFLARPALAAAIAAGLACGTLILLFRTMRQIAGKLGPRRLAVISSLCLGVWISSHIITTVIGHDQNGSRHVIIIGVDSLSHVAYEKLQNHLPNISGLMKSGTSYERAYTPIGRTFPAWMSILSGQNPAQHGGVFNLRNMEQVEKSPLVSNELRKAGYRTVYAIDERRFNNIDESFGFDEVVGPEAGALDFAIQRFNDAPLTNLLLQTRVGRIAMPFSYTNTASWTNYDARGFVNNILHATDGADQLFLATHFESAHFPFQTRHATEKFSDSNSFWNAHAAALTVVDAQVGQLLQGLQYAGFLNNALVIVLSDHGEGLGEIEVSSTLGSEPYDLNTWGHGTSVVSDHQNHIILSAVEFRNGKSASSSRSDNRQVSLIDLKPAIEQYIHSGTISLEPTRQCLFVETGLRFTAAADYRKLDVAQLAANTASYYEIDSAGRMRLREEDLQDLVPTKDVGLRCKDRLTFYSFSQDKFFELSLDEKGLPKQEQMPNAQSVQQINEYRKMLRTRLNASDS